VSNVLFARVLPVAATLAAVLSFTTAGAASVSGIDRARSSVGDSASMGAAGRTLHLVGVVRCAGCRTFTLGATVSQRTSGAVAQGGVRCVCHGAVERWRLVARARESTAFQPGAARVCVWVIARSSAARPIDARQWCESVALKRVEA